MEFKKLMLISSFLLCILLIGAVSAASDANDMVEIDDSADEIIEANANLDNAIGEESDFDEILSSEDSTSDVVNVAEDGTLGTEVPSNSFSALQSYIEVTDEMSLSHDYSYDSGTDENLKSGIVVKKTFTINGNGHTIDGKGVARIFNVTNGATLTINNLKLCNGFVEESDNTFYSSGGAINLNNSNLIVNGCIFDNNRPRYFGGAIVAYNSSNLTVSGSTFSNNNGTAGGVIYIKDSNCTVTGSTFTLNEANYGGSIYAIHSVLNVSKSDFAKNSAHYEAGAICLSDTVGFVKDSTFINNYPDSSFTSYHGGAICSKESSNLTVTNSTFKNNSAFVKEGYYQEGSAIYSDDNGVLNIIGSVFANNIPTGVSIRAKNGMIIDTKFIDGDTVSGDIQVVDCKSLITPVFTIGSISSIVYGSPITISVTEANGLNGTVTVAIGSEKYTIAISKGSGSKTVTPKLLPGKYNAVLSFIENDKFVSASLTGNVFAISKANAYFVASNKVVNAPKYKTYKITLKTKKGKAIKKTKVTLKIGKKTFKAKTNKKGVATFKILYSKISKAERSSPYKVTAKIIKNKKVKTLKGNKLSLKVDGKTYNRKTNKKGIAIFKAKKPVSIREYAVDLKAANGKAFSKASVSLTVNGKTYKATTDANGKASFKLNNLNKNSKFKVAISYGGNTYYNKCTKTAYITINDR